MDKVLNNSPETNAIRERMKEVRCDLDEHVQEIVEGTRDMGDWRSYVRSFPWICLGAAVAVGYSFVPRRPVAMQPDTQTLAELANQSPLLATSNLPSRGKARGMLLGFFRKLVIRTVTSYVQQQAGKFLAIHAAKSQQDDQR